MFLRSHAHPSSPIWRYAFLRSINVHQRAAKMQRLHFSFRTEHSVSQAQRLLGLSSNNTEKYTGKQIREAYFAAAKRCHPDTLGVDQKSKSDNETVQAAAQKFMQITEAYEVLLNYTITAGEFMDQYQVDEEKEFRQACRDYLQLPAEIVEESKRCPMFRKWLIGNTDSAFHWRMFLQLHGGLAPKLKSSFLSIQAGSNISTSDVSSVDKPVIRRRRNR